MTSRAQFRCFKERDEKETPSPNKGKIKLRKIFLLFSILILGACTKSGPIDAGEIRKEFDQDPKKILAHFHGGKIEIVGMTYMLISNAEDPHSEVESSPASLISDLNKKPIIIRLGNYEIPGKAREYISIPGTRVVIICKEFKPRNNIPYFDGCDILKETVIGPPLLTVYSKNKD